MTDNVACDRFDLLGHLERDFLRWRCHVRLQRESVLETRMWLEYKMTVENEDDDNDECEQIGMGLRSVWCGKCRSLVRASARPSGLLVPGHEADRKWHVGQS